jgi:predicted ArsR family transcriptional regulator
MAARLSPTMRAVLQVLGRERPLTAHAIAGTLQINVRRVEHAIARLRGENLVTVASFDAMGYPAFKRGSSIGDDPGRRRR